MTELCFYYRALMICSIQNLYDDEKYIENIFMLIHSFKNHIMRKIKLIKIRKNKNRDKISNLGKTMYLIQFSSPLPILLKGIYLSLI